MAYIKKKGTKPKKKVAIRRKKPTRRKVKKSSIA
jgi:hypothetical protein